MKTYTLFPGSTIRTILAVAILASAPGCVAATDTGSDAGTDPPPPGCAWVDKTLTDESEDPCQGDYGVERTASCPNSPPPMGNPGTSCTAHPSGTAGLYCCAATIPCWPGTACQ